MRHAAWLLTATIILLGTAKASAKDLPANWYVDAGIALARSDCTAAVDLMERGAAAGEAAGLYPARSFYLFHDCAEPDAAERIFRIGLRLADGDGMPQDDKASVAWLEWAEHLGHVQAMHRLGVLGLIEFRGDRVAQWRIEWAATTGDPAAQRDMAAVALQVRRGPIAKIDALMWLLRAQQNGGDVDEEIAAIGAEADEYVWKEARKAAAKPPPGGDDLWWEPHFWVAVDKSDCPTAKHYLDAAVAADSDEAIGLMPDFYERQRNGSWDCFSIDFATHKGILEFVVAKLPDKPEPKQKLAEFLLDGPYRETHAQEAERLMRLAVLDIGPFLEDDRQYLIGSGMIWSDTGKKAYLQAVDWFMALAPDDAARSYRVYEIFEAGDGFARDDRRARDWLRAAARRGITEAYYELAMLTLDGTWNFDTTEQAVGYLQSGASDDHGPAQAEFGRRLAKGDGVEQNQALAYLWLVRAGINGEDVADLRARVGSRLSILDRVQIVALAIALPAIDWVSAAFGKAYGFIRQLFN